MVLYGPLSSPLVLYGPLLSFMVPYGLVWSHMVPYGPLWSCLVSFVEELIKLLNMLAFVQLTQLLHKFFAY